MRHRITILINPDHHRCLLTAMADRANLAEVVGTGPFRVTDHTLGQSITLEKFDKYHDPERPKLDKVVIKPTFGLNRRS